MSNPTPEQMLKLTKICEPDIEWEIVDINLDGKGDKPTVFWGDEYECRVFSPLNNDAQLMQVVFAVAKKINHPDREWSAKRVILIDALSQKNQQAILSLAVEVLL
jgi:hypothetical protein